MDSKEKVAIILWLYHHDLWEEFLSLLIPIKDKTVLHIGLCEDHDNTNIIDSVKNNFSDYNITTHPNCAVDVKPFLHQLSSVKEEFFIKLHSKKSNWGFKKHVNWRSVLVHSLIGSREIFEKNIELLKNNDNIGMVCNKNLILSNREGSHSNKIKKLCSILNIEYDKALKKKFCGGNMFAAKTALYKKYFSPLSSEIKNLLSLEKNQKFKDKTPGGTYSHSLERIFGYIIEYNNMTIANSPVQTLKLLNKEAPNGKYFNLVINYDNSCYITEDLNASGKVVHLDRNKLLVAWDHLDIITYQEYELLNSNFYNKIF
jgi:lipopolysaccharide biosynthesis protein